MSKNKTAHVLLRGGGDLATGVALRLYRAGIRLVIVELAQPLAVRRTVSFAEAVYAGHHTVEGVTSRLVKRDQLQASLDADEIPVLIDPDVDILSTFQFPIVVDARLLKTTPPPLTMDVPHHIGLGPGFHAGENCHAVIETRRSHTLGRVYWTGTTQPDSGEPEGDPRRVLRSSGWDINFQSKYRGACGRRTVVVVGGRNSAAEAALDLYRAGARVTLVHREAALGGSIKYWVKPDIENRITEGSIPAMFETTVRQITSTAVHVAGPPRRCRTPGGRRVPADGLSPRLDTARAGGCRRRSRGGGRAIRS